MVKGFLVKMSLSVIFLLVFSLRFVDMTIGEKITEHPLETAWKVTGLPLVAVDTATWVKLNNKWLSGYDLKQYSERIKGQLGLTLRTKISVGEQNEINYASFEGNLHDGTVVTVTLQSSSSEGSGETQLGINTDHNGSVHNLGSYLDGLKLKIAKVSKDGHFGITLTGERRGRIPELLVKELAGKAFRRIDAKLVESGFVNGNSSQKGYTHLINDAIKYDSKQFNIEIGTRYDDVRNITEIIMASPNMTDGV